MAKGWTAGIQCPEWVENGVKRSCLSRPHPAPAPGPTNIIYFLLSIFRGRRSVPLLMAVDMALEEEERNAYEF